MHIRNHFYCPDPRWWKKSSVLDIFCFLSALDNNHVMFSMVWEFQLGKSDMKEQHKSMSQNPLTLWLQWLVNIGIVPSSETSWNLHGDIFSSRPHFWFMSHGNIVSLKRTGNIALQALNFKGYYKFFTSQKVSLTGMTCTFLDLVS